MNDCTAFKYLCATGSWPEWAFIGRDELQGPMQVETEGLLYLLNRWVALLDFPHFLESLGYALDEGAAKAAILPPLYCR